METARLTRSFRSRGISLTRQGTEILCRQKRYYDMEDSLLPASLRRYVELGLLTAFEYSLDQGDRLDTLNFHVTAGKDPNCLYEGLPEMQRRIINAVPDLFNERFLLYTVGFRMAENDIAGRTFYFYPTVQRGDRVGIKGVEDPAEIRGFCKRFTQYFPPGAEEEIGHYAEAIVKFKGVSVTVLHNGDADYKLYGRVLPQGMDSHLKKYSYPGGEQFQAFGDVVLTAIRLSESGVKGYNLYYLR